MKQKHVDMMREVRLWCGQLIIPAITAGAVILTNPNVQNKISEMKANRTRKKFKVYNGKES